VVERIQAIADRNIRRYGLLEDEDVAADLPGEATNSADTPLLRALAEAERGPQ
jgi:hypothetical protein